MLNEEERKAKDEANEKQEVKWRQKRARIVEELLKTEETYQKHIRLVVKYFEEPLREFDLIPSHVIVTVFSNIRQILRVNEELYTDLQNKPIGEAFLELGPFLKLYSTYANNHETALAALLEWEQKIPEFAAWRRQQEEEQEIGGLKLNALLITPVQRVPRYKLLLQDLLDHTERTHTDYESIAEACRQIGAVATHINNHIKQQDNSIRMVAIQRSLVGAPRLILPGRLFIKDGIINKVTKKGGRAVERMFYLFSDQLMYAKQRKALHLPVRDSDTSAANTTVGSSRWAGAKYECCCILPLQHCTVSRVLGQSGGREQATLFTVQCKDVSLLLFSDQKTVDSWINALTKAIGELVESRKSLRKESSAKAPVRGGALIKYRKQQDQADPLNAKARTTLKLKRRRRSNSVGAVPVNKKESCATLAGARLKDGAGVGSMWDRARESMRNLAAATKRRKQQKLGKENINTTLALDQSSVWQGEQDATILQASTQGLNLLGVNFPECNLNKVTSQSMFQLNVPISQPQTRCINNDNNLSAIDFEVHHHLGQTTHSSPEEKEDQRHSVNEDSEFISPIRAVSPVCRKEANANEVSLRPPVLCQVYVDNTDYCKEPSTPSAFVNRDKEMRARRRGMLFETNDLNPVLSVTPIAGYAKLRPPFQQGGKTSTPIQNSATLKPSLQAEHDVSFNNDSYQSAIPAETSKHIPRLRSVKNRKGTPVKVFGNHTTLDTNDETIRKKSTIKTSLCRSLLCSTPEQERDSHNFDEQPIQMGIADCDIDTKYVGGTSPVDNLTPRNISELDTTEQGKSKKANTHCKDISHEISPISEEDEERPKKQSTCINESTNSTPRLPPGTPVLRRTIAQQFLSSVSQNSPTKLRLSPGGVLLARTCSAVDCNEISEGTPRRNIRLLSKVTATPSNDTSVTKSLGRSMDNIPCKTIDPVRTFENSMKPADKNNKTICKEDHENVSAHNDSTQINKGINSNAQHQENGLHLIRSERCSGVSNDPFSATKDGNIKGWVFLIDGCTVTHSHTDFNNSSFASCASLSLSVNNKTSDFVGRVEKRDSVRLGEHCADVIPLSDHDFSDNSCSSTPTKASAATQLQGKENVCFISKASVSLLPVKSTFDDSFYSNPSNSPATLLANDTRSKLGSPHVNSDFNKFEIPSSSKKKVELFGNKTNQDSFYSNSANSPTPSDSCLNAQNRSPAISNNETAKCDFDMITSMPEEDFGVPIRCPVKRRSTECLEEMNTEAKRPCANVSCESVETQVHDSFYSNPSSSPCKNKRYISDSKSHSFCTSAPINLQTENLNHAHNKESLNRILALDISSSTGSETDISSSNDDACSESEYSEESVTQGSNSFTDESSNASTVSNESNTSRNTSSGRHRSVHSADFSFESSQRSSQSSLKTVTNDIGGICEESETTNGKDILDAILCLQEESPRDKLDMVQSKRNSDVVYYDPHTNKSLEDLSHELLEKYESIQKSYTMSTPHLTLTPTCSYAQSPVCSKTLDSGDQDSIRRDKSTRQSTQQSCVLSPTVEPIRNISLHGESTVSLPIDSISLVNCANYDSSDGAANSTMSTSIGDLDERSLLELSRQYCSALELPVESNDVASTPQSSPQDTCHKETGFAIPEEMTSGRILGTHLSTLSVQNYAQEPKRKRQQESSELEQTKQRTPLCEKQISSEDSQTSATAEKRSAYAMAPNVWKSSTLPSVVQSPDVSLNLKNPAMLRLGANTTPRAEASEGSQTPPGQPGRRPPRLNLRNEVQASLAEATMNWSSTLVATASPVRMFYSPGSQNRAPSQNCVIQ